jgi:PAS domain S-box-containing protein
MKIADTKTQRNLKLSILIFALLAAGILTAGYFYYIDYEHKYRSVVERQLSAIAELKVGELVQWRKERMADAQLFFDNEVFSLIVKRCFKNRNDRDAKTRIVAWMGEMQKANNYDLAMLVDANFNTKLVVPEDKKGVHLILDEQITETLRSGNIAFQDFYRNDRDQRVYLKVLVPIRDIDSPKTLLGILALRIDPEEYLYPLIQQWPIPSRTSETLIVRKEGSDALFLNELKFQTNSALNLRIPLTHTNTPAVEAALGKEGIIEGVDYRGMPVIADIRSVPNSPWFLVARVDISEAYAPVRERLSMLIFLIIALLLGSGASVGLLWRREHALFYRQQYETAQELIASESRYRRLFEAARDGILILDAETGMVVDVNPFLVEMLGYSREQFFGKRIWELGFFKDIAASKLNFTKLQEKEFIQYENLPLETGKGGLINVEFVSHVYSVNDEKVIQCNIRDITERKRAEESVRERAIELNARNQELERFNNVATGRELRMIELKREINDLCRQIGEPPRYRLDFEEPDSILAAGEQKGTKS